MNDDDLAVTVDGETVLYDYLKHLTSLCLFSLGGVAALADRVHGRSSTSLVLTLAVIGLAAFSSFFATGMIVEARLARKPVRRSINLYRHASPFLLSIGVGMFLYLFVEAQGS